MSYSLLWHDRNAKLHTIKKSLAILLNALQAQNIEIPPSSVDAIISLSDYAGSEPSVASYRRLERERPINLPSAIELYMKSIACAKTTKLGICDSFEKKHTTFLRDLEK